MTVAIVSLLFKASESDFFQADASQNLVLLIFLCCFYLAMLKTGLIEFKPINTKAVIIQVWLFHKNTYLS